MTEQTRLELERQAKEMLAQAERMCSRCGGEFADSWEDGWPNSGNIRIGRAAQAFMALRRHLHDDHRYIADKDDFDFWEQAQRGEHPAFVELGAQHLEIEWGHDKPCRICRGCQDDLLALLGEFFIGKEEPKP